MRTAFKPSLRSRPRASAISCLTCPYSFLTTRRPRPEPLERVLFQPRMPGISIAHIVVDLTSRRESSPRSLRCNIFVPNVVSTAIFLEFPITIVEWADLTSLQPSRDTMKMECVLERVISFLAQTHSFRRTLHIPQATVHSSLVAEP